MSHRRPLARRPAQLRKQREGALSYGNEHRNAQDDGGSGLNVDQYAIVADERDAAASQKMREQGRLARRLRSGKQYGADRRFEGRGVQVEESIDGQPPGDQQLANDSH